MQGRGLCGAAVAAAAFVFMLGYAPSSQAVRFEYDFLGGIQGTLNTSVSLGAQWRISDRNPNVIGTANLNPRACRSLCQPHLSTEPGDVPGRVQLGLDGEGNTVNQLGINAPGGASINHDDGNLNFDQWDVTQAVAQIDQDITLRFREDFGFVQDLQFFMRYNAFHDFVNYNREQYYPNYYLPEDRARDDARRNSGEYGFPTVGSEVFRDTGDKYNEYLGQDIDILDAFVQGTLPTAGLFGTDMGDMRVTIGEQTINWGESTLFVVNSLNTVNPPNVNALFRPAFLDLATVFEPIGAVKVSAPLTRNTSFTAFYQYDWEPVEIPPRGGFLSFFDVTLGADDNFVNPGFGQGPDDPDGNMRAEQQLLTAVADVDGRVPVDEEPASKGGQYGFAFTWYAPDFNNGTEFRFYYLNYHSRLPYASAFAGAESCLQSVPTGNTTTDTANLLADCPNADQAHFLGAVGQHQGGQAGGQAATILGQTLNQLPTEDMSTQPNGEPCPADLPPGTGPCAEAYPIDSFSLLLEYPEDINVYGISFNTSFGDISMQGEIAYRPNLPLQVDDIDVAFAALQPSAPVGCADGEFNQNQGSDCRPATFDDRYTIGLPGVADLADTIQNGGDLVGAIGNLLGEDSTADQAQAVLNQVTAGLAGAGLDLSDLADGLSGVSDDVVLSDPVGRRNAFPDYLTEYRGRSPGSVRPGEYIQGYERFQVMQYNLGFTYVIGPDNWIKSNQIILLFEVGATHVLGFPDKDELQIEGPGTFNHRSVGNDGSGAPACPDGVQQGTSEQESGNTRLCGPFQLRFNPTQQRNGYATAFSWGYNIIGILRYENVLPGISIEPIIIWQQDIDGIAPGPGENFVEGQKQLTANVAMRVGEGWSYTVGATFFFGAEKRNYLADRDFLQVGLEYRF